MATLIKVDGTRSELDLKQGPRVVTLLQDAVGGCFEPLSGAIGLNGQTMWINEEGLLRGLPTNEAASRLIGHRVVGDVVLTSPDEVG